MPSTAAYCRARYRQWRFNVFVRSRPFFFPGVSISEPVRALLGLLGQGSTVSLLLDNPVPVSMVIVTVDQTCLGQMRSPVSLASFFVQGFPFSNLLWGGCWWFGSLWFVLPLGSMSFTFSLQNLLLVFLVPLPFTRSLGSNFFFRWAYRTQLTSV